MITELGTSNNNNNENNITNTNNGTIMNTSNNGGRDLSSTSSGRTATKAFAPEHVFMTDSGQAEVYESVAQDLVYGILNGYNAAIIAYGQTGSGKTHTMLGEPTSTSQAGVIPRAIADIFQRIEELRQEYSTNNAVFNAEVKASYIEIYQEQPFDLLAYSNTDEGTTSTNANTLKRRPNNNDEPKSKLLRIREGNDTDGFFLEDLCKVTLNSPAHAMDVLAAGFSARRTSSTAMNARSSRSHAVLSLSVEIKITTKDENNIEKNTVRTGLLDIVDLAGSERQRDTGAEGSTIKEAGKINNSLGCLAEVIKTCVDNQMAKHSRMVKPIPWRNSRLTMLLKRSLSGNSRTAMIFTISPALEYWGESLNTLMFADRARRLKTEPSTNERTVLMGGTQVQVTQMAKEIATLRAALVKASSQNGGDNTYGIGTNFNGSFDFSSFGTWNGITENDVSRRMDFTTTENNSTTNGIDTTTNGIPTSTTITTNNKLSHDTLSPIILKRIDEINDLSRLLLTINQRGAVVMDALNALPSSDSTISTTPDIERLSARMKSPSITNGAASVAQQLAAALVATQTTKDTQILESNASSISAVLNNLTQLTNTSSVYGNAVSPLQNNTGTSTMVTANNNDSAVKRLRTSRSSDVSDSIGTAFDENTNDYRPLPYRPDEHIPDGMSASTDMVSGNDSPCTQDDDQLDNDGLIPQPPMVTSSTMENSTTTTTSNTRGNTGGGIDELHSMLMRIQALERILGESARKDALLAEVKEGMLNLIYRQNKVKSSIVEFGNTLQYLNGPTASSTTTNTNGAIHVLQNIQTLLRNLYNERHNFLGKIHDLNNHIQEQSIQIQNLQANMLLLSHNTVHSCSTETAIIPGMITIPVDGTTATEDNTGINNESMENNYEVPTQEINLGTENNDTNTATTTAAVSIHHRAVPLVLPRQNRLVFATHNISHITNNTNNHTGMNKLGHHHHHHHAHVQSATTKATNDTELLTSYDTTESSSHEVPDSTPYPDPSPYGNDDNVDNSDNLAPMIQLSNPQYQLSNLINGQSNTVMEENNIRGSFLRPFVRGASEVYMQARPRVSTVKPIEIMASNNGGRQRSASLASSSAVSTTASRNTSLGSTNDLDLPTHNDGPHNDRESLGAPDQAYDDAYLYPVSSRPSAVSIAESTASIGTSISGRIQVLEATSNALLNYQQQQQQQSSSNNNNNTVTANVPPPVAAVTVPTVVKKPLASLIQRTAPK